MIRKGRLSGNSLRWAVLAGGFAAGFMLLYPLASHAFWRRVQASACHPDTLISGTAFVLGSDGTVANKHTTNGAYVFCPVPDDMNLPKTSIVTINVNGYDAHPSANVAASACGTLEVTGAFCGPQVTSSGTGSFSLHPVPQNGAWSGTNAPYIWAVLPPMSGGNYSKISDVYVSN
jgi:hypothetical protein